MQLSRGQKLPVRELIPNGSVFITIDYYPTDIDIAAFSLDKDRKIKDDRYTILFSNQQSPDNSITLNLQTGKAIFTIDIDRLPTTIERIIFTATHDIHAIGKAKKLDVSVGQQAAIYNAKEGLTTEKAVMMIELYRYHDTWRLGAIGQGFDGGLAALITHFGGEIASPTSTSTSPPSPSSSPTPPRLNLNKITLEQKQSISLTKTTPTFGEIKVNLNWSRGSSARKGFFGKISSNKAIDLDLGCLYVLKNGEKSVVQALGKRFGDLNKKPYVKLLGDDRTGDIDSGETLLINGKFFDEIERIAIFAYIYDGVPNWNETNGVVTLTVPDQPPLEVRMTEGHNNRTMCGIALIDNVNGQMKVSRLVEYFKDHEEFANSVHIFLKWVGARKD
ncbi:Stress response protein SCP2 (TerZ) (PDB:2QNG) [Commensalibacter communis]|uniref:TerD family protein n=1 Tax=Commensalibacter communis TaxID=2972786 RepID=UPI0022FFBF8A|nr:TerD family protein [Commensalibacter communis]CAI3947807.1 Stress response protein SCP2 (TerZ) (PDB:2QNG) [Commensalibacter communis]